MNPEPVCRVLDALGVRAQVDTRRGDADDPLGGVVDLLLRDGTDWQDLLVASDPGSA